MFSAFFLTLIPTSFPFGSTYSKLVSDYMDDKSQTKMMSVKKQNGLSICKRDILTDIWYVCSIISSTARSDPFEIR